MWICECAHSLLSFPPPLPLPPSPSPSPSLSLSLSRALSRPDDGWTHNTAALAVGQGVYYSFPVRYVGSIQVMESMRSLSMPDKTSVCWEAIARCCDAAGLRTKKQKKRKVSKVVQKFLADSPYVKVMELKINLSVEGTNEYKEWSNTLRTRCCVCVCVVSIA